MKISSTQRRTILIVDDDPSVLGMMDETLSDNGYSVLLAQSGASALEVVARTVPDGGFEKPYLRLFVCNNINGL